MSAYRLVRLRRSGLLWSVSGKLILSYILVGAVPILLLVTFFLVGILLIFFDVSSYLVHSRIADVTAQAATMARTTLSEVVTVEETAREAMVARRQSAIAERYPKVQMTLTSADALPGWVQGRGFAGLVDGADVVRAVAIRRVRARGYALIVDLPVAAALDRSELSAAGVSLGEGRTRSFFNRTTSLTAVDWKTGAPRSVTVGMGVDVPKLYGWLVAAPLRQPGSAPVDQQASASFNRIVLFMLLSIGLLLFVIEMVALGHGLALARTITTSVHELFTGTERVKAGAFDQRIPVRTNDQLGQLSASFNDMTARIQLLVAEQDEKRRLEEELRIAREIQMSLLPRAGIQTPGLSIAALCAPAREVGGDYYDVLPLSDGRVGLLIADVSGKGTSAALYMAELKGLMLSLSRIHSSPRALLIDANDIISKHLDSRSFITMTYAIVDAKARTLTCARAGHTPFIRVRGGQGHARSEVLVPDGMVLGLNLDGGKRFERCLEELTIPIAGGDLFFFFTDGISEAMDAGGGCFGEARIATFLEAHADRTTEEMRDQLAVEVAAFVQDAPQHDDITMVIVKIEAFAD